MYVTYITGQAAYRSNNMGQSRFCFSLVARGTKSSMQQWHNASFIRTEAGAVISLRPGRLRDRGSISSSGKRLFLLQSVQKGAEAQPALYWMGAGGSPSQVCEYDHSPPSGAQVNNIWSYTSTLSACLHAAYRDNFSPWHRFDRQVVFTRLKYPNYFCVINIKMDLQEVGRSCGDWMELSQDRGSWWALVSTVMNFRVP